MKKKKRANTHFPYYLISHGAERKIYLHGHSSFGFLSFFIWFCQLLRSWDQCELVSQPKSHEVCRLKWIISLTPYNCK